MDELFVLRDMRAGDLDAVNALGHSEGFGTVQDSDLVRLAVNEDDEMVGFCRMVVDEGICYVNPVVVHGTWRGFGVGRSLIDEALARFGEVRLVSRGWSAGFYEAMGFEPCPWELIVPSIIDECAACELRGECGPQPMRKRA